MDLTLLLVWAAWVATLSLVVVLPYLAISMVSGALNAGEAREGKRRVAARYGPPPDPLPDALDERAVPDDLSEDSPPRV